jgi:hypothetical protein
MTTVPSSQTHNYTGVTVAVGRIVLHGPQEVLPTGRLRGSDLRRHAVDGRLRQGRRLLPGFSRQDRRRPARPGLLVERLGRT